MHPVLAILLITATEIYLGWICIERGYTNAHLRETTATVVTEPTYVVIDHRTRSMWDLEGAYQFTYTYEVDGRTYSGSGQTAEKPGQTAAVFYDPDFPSNSRTTKEKTGLLLLCMLALGGALAYNISRIDIRFRR